jgi:hypothetical protein
MLDKLIISPRPALVDSAIRKGSRIAVLAFGEASPATPITAATARAASTTTARSTSFICGRNSGLLRRRFHGGAARLQQSGCKAW